MTTPLDVLVKNARLPRSGESVAVGVRGDTITAVDSDAELDAATTIDADGGLVTPAFVDPHLHLDKVYTLDRAGETAIERYQNETTEMGDAMGAIEAASDVKDDYDEDRIYENARRAIEDGVAHGVLHHRVFADTDTSAGLEGVNALLRLRDDLADVVTLDVVAFPQDGVVRDPGALDVVADAMDRGADAVGGIPWLEYTDADQREHVDRVFELAEAYDADVAMLTDDAGDPGLRTTELLASKTIETGWEGRVTACHARAMELYPEPYLQKLLALLDRAGVDVVSDPQTGPLHAPVDALLDAGVTVSLGQDDIADAYYPFGQNDMLEVGFLVAHLLWKTTAADLEDVYEMLTYHGANSLNLDRYGLTEGCRADLLVYDVDSLHDLFQYRPKPTTVLSAGRVVAQTTTETSVDLQPND